MAYPADAYSWARIVLGSNSTDLPDTTLALFLTGAERDLIQTYPCVAGGDITGSVSLSGNDLTFFSEAVGRYIAASISLDPFGSSFAGGVQEIRVGPVTEKRGTVSSEQAAKGLQSGATRAMMRIGCVRNGITGARVANQGDQYALSGHRRALGEPSTIQGAAIGGGEVTAVETTDGVTTTTTFYP